MAETGNTSATTSTTSTGRLATKIPSDLFDHIAVNAGILLSTFDTATWTVDVTKIIGATTGGINFTDTPSFTDYGEDIDNCPKNTKQLKRIDDREIKISGTFVTLTPAQASMLATAADVTEAEGYSKVIARQNLTDDDFTTLWFVTDYGANNAVAIKIENVLSTGGFSFQTTDKAKGTFSFEFTAHFSSALPDSVPYIVYFKS